MNRSFLSQTSAGSSLFCSTQPSGTRRRNLTFFTLKCRYSSCMHCKVTDQQSDGFQASWVCWKSSVDVPVAEAGLLQAVFNTIQCWAVALTHFCQLISLITFPSSCLHLHRLCVSSGLLLLITRCVVPYGRLHSSLYSGWMGEAAASRQRLFFYPRKSDCSENTWGKYT